MLRLIVYISRLFLTRLAVSSLGMVVLAGLLDSLANASEISASDIDWGAIRYVTLRAPVIFDQIFLFSLMLALLLTFVSLIRRNELVALQGMGLSVFAQIRALAPVILIACAAAGFYIDRTLPGSVQALNDWGIGAYAGGNVSTDEPLWINDNDLFVRISGREGLSKLRDVTFFQRDDNGDVLGVTWAEEANYNSEIWTLDGISSLSVEGVEKPPQALVVWDTSQTPLMIDKLAAEPRDLSVDDMQSFASIRGSGSRPSAAYKVWYFKRLILPASGLAMLLFAAPLMQRVGRRETGTGALIIGVGIGFLFIMVDGIVATTGSNGALTPLIAALAPSLVLAGAGIYMWLQSEILG